MIYNDLTEAWVRDLESDYFMQTQYILRDAENGMCCLGVLADRAITTPDLMPTDCFLRWSDEPEDGDDGDNNEAARYRLYASETDIGGTGTLPLDFRLAALKMSDRDQSSLFGANDDYDMTFTQIAQLIRLRSGFAPYEDLAMRQNLLEAGAKFHETGLLVNSWNGDFFTE